MGQELLWLSQVLPLAAEGNYEPYDTTAMLSRQLELQKLQQLIPILQQLLYLSPEAGQILQQAQLQEASVLLQKVYGLALPYM